MKAAPPRFIAILSLLLVVSLAVNVGLWVTSRPREETIPADAGNPPGHLRQGERQRPARSIPASASEEDISSRFQTIWAASGNSNSSRKLLVQWARKDALQAIDFIAHSLEGTAREEMLALIVGTWAESRPAEAARWFDAAPAHLRGDEVAQALVTTWAATAPEEAAQWLDQLQDPSLRSTISELLADIWGKQDGAAAMAWVEKAAVREDLGATLHIVLESWIAADPDAVRRHLNQIKDPSVALESHRVFGAEIAATDPQAAWSFVSQISDVATRQETAISVIDVWADDKPSQAATKVFAEPDPTTQAEMARTLIAKWIHTDPATSADWLETLPQGPAKEAAIETVAEQLAEPAPLRSLDWALRLQSVPARIEAIETAFFILAEQDLQAARAWVLQADLPEELRGMADRLPNE